MKYTVFLKSQPGCLLFLSIILFFSVLAFYTSQILPKGGVWEDCLAAGTAFLSGTTPELPAYPMWGYSLLSGVFKEYTVLFQGAVLMVVCFFWYGSILRLFAPLHSSGKLARIVINPIFVSISLVPFVFLGLSYFSNSIAYILSFGGMWLLYLAIEEGKGRAVWYATTSGFIFGLGFNFRSEVFLLGVLFFFSIFLYGLMVQRKRHYLGIAAMFVIPLFILASPWVIYTSFTVKQPLISSTNGGAVAYLGLGVLSDNPWGIVDSDDFVTELAENNISASPWSYEANQFFRNRYLEAIKEHPWGFSERVVIGWRQMLTQGVYFPNFRKLSSSDEKEDEVAIDYVNERLKIALGFNVNEQQWEEYLSKGLKGNDLSFGHYAIVIFEYFLRGIYLALFLILLIASVLLSVKTRFSNFMSVIFSTHIVFTLVISGFLHTLPRHTTLLLPVLLSTVIVLSCQLARKKECGYK